MQIVADPLLAGERFLYPAEDFNSVLLCSLGGSARFTRWDCGPLIDMNCC